MSLVSTAIRIITARALLDATYAGKRVYDSAIDPIDQTITEEKQPVITVNTDDVEGEVKGRDLLASDVKIDLVIEMAVAQKVSVKIENETAEDIVIPHTDAGLELVLNLMGRQIDRALIAGNKWSDLWRQFVMKVDMVATRRGASAEKGVRFAARQITYKLVGLAEPSFGPIAENGPWARLLACLREVPELVSVADLIEAEITAPTMVEWRKVAADLGLRDYGALKIGIGPAFVPEPGETAPPLDTVTVDFDGGQWTGNAQTLSDPLPPEEDENDA